MKSLSVPSAFFGALVAAGLMGALSKKSSVSSAKMPLSGAQAKTFHEISLRGKAHADKKNFRAAAEEFKKALLIWPDHADTYVNLGNVFFYGKKLRLAWDCYGMSLKLQPNQPQMRAWLKEKKATLRTFTAKDGAAFLKWEAARGAQGYLVYRKRGPGLPDLRLVETPLREPEFVARGMVPGERGVFAMTQLVVEKGKTFEEPLGEIMGCAVPLSLYEAQSK